MLPGAITALAQAAAPEDTANLAGWWTFDDGSAEDVSGNNNFGNLLGTKNPWPVDFIGTSQDGPPITALGFDGSTSYVDVPNWNSAGLTALSCTFWVWHSSAAGGPRAVSDSHTDSDLNGFQITVGSNFAITIGNGATIDGINDGTAFATGVWEFCAAVFDAAGIVLYRNAVNVASNGTALTLSAGSSTLGFGRANAYAGDYLSGMLRDVRLYANRKLTQGDLVDLFLRGLQQLDEGELPALVAAATGSVGAAAGVGAAAAAGQSTASSTGAAAGTGAATGVGASTASAVGSAAGVGAASGVGSSIASAVGAAAGIAAAAAVGASTASAVGAASGAGSQAGVGASTAVAVGSASGLGAAAGISFVGSIGAASGIGAASAVGSSIAVAVGSASGSSSASGISSTVVVNTSQPVDTHDGLRRYEDDDGDVELEEKPRPLPEKVRASIERARARIEGTRNLTPAQASTAESVIRNIEHTVARLEFPDAAPIGELIKSLNAVATKLADVEQRAAIARLKQVEQELEDEHAAVLLLLAA